MSNPLSSRRPASIRKSQVCPRIGCSTTASSIGEVRNPFEVGQYHHFRILDDKTIRIWSRYPLFAFHVQHLTTSLVTPFTHCFDSAPMTTVLSRTQRHRIHHPASIHSLFTRRVPVLTAILIRVSSPVIVCHRYAMAGPGLVPMSCYSPHVA